MPTQTPKIRIRYTGSGTPVAFAKRRSDGYRYNPTAAAFQASPSDADAAIALTNGSGVYAGVYDSAALSGMGDAGMVDVTIHDSANSYALLAFEPSAMYVLGGMEVLPPDANVTHISGDSAAAGVRAAIGMAAANLDTQLADLSGDIGDVNVTVTPLAVTVSAGEVSGVDLVAYQYCGFSFLLTITDDNGDPIDLSGKTVSLVIHDLESPTAEVFELTTGAGLTVVGASHNQVSVAADSTHTQSAGVFRWFMRDITTPTSAVPLGAGSFTINETAPDA